MRTSSTRPDGTTLVVPDGCLIDRIAVARLESTLRASPADVVAIVAPVQPLHSGASYRSDAQRRALASHEVVTADPGQPVVGAALVREGAAVRIDARGAVADAGRVLVDRGALTHDPSGPVGPLAPAVPEGRSPFPRAPLVVFIGLEPDAGRAVWARNLVNELLEHDVEARLATTSVPDGPHHTRPCAPGPDTIRALAADVVVTLDDESLEQVGRWCDRRSTVVVHHTGERTLDVELVPWRIGASEGRLRALIGSAITAPAMARLCSRLCAGPLVLPPRRDEVEGTSRVSVRTRPDKPKRQVAVVYSSESDRDERLESFLTEAGASGASVRSLGPADALSGVDLDVLVVAGDVDPGVVQELVERRRALGRATLADVCDLERSRALVDLCGLAVTPTRTTQEAIEGSAVPVRLLPTLLTRTSYDAMRRSRFDPESDDELPDRLGVALVDTDPAPLAAFGAAVERLLEHDPDLLVEVDGDDNDLVRSMLAEPRVSLLPSMADVRRRWRAAVHLASSEPDVGRPRWLLETSCAALPTVFDAASAGDVTDEIICRWAVDDPADADAWFDRLSRALGATAAERHALAGRSDLLFGPKASASIVNRILGWASQEVAPR